MRQAATLAPGQIRHLLRVTNATSRHPERDCLILLLGITAGLRISEIGQIEIQDVLFPSGALRQEVSLRACFTKGNKQRCIYLTHRQTIAALERYIAYRLEHGIGTELTRDRFRGLSPETKLILKRSGGNFSMNTKRRTNFDGEQVDYKAADSLQSHVTRLYLNAGIKASSHSGRRTMASRLIAQGQSVETVQLLLGHADIECTYQYLAVDSKKLREMFAVVL
jgi:site-specific recombinase XerD